MTLLIQMEMMNTWLKVKSKVVWKMMMFLSSQLNLEEENLFIDVLHEGDKTNEDSFNFHFNVSVYIKLT